MTDEIITLKDFEENTIVNPDGFNFKISCKKCNSTDILIEVDDDIRCGSEYTGMWGESLVVIKCRGCGNAYNIIAYEA